jgi:hypothetical protein
VERDELKQLLEQMLNAHKKSVRVQENMLGMLARLKQRPQPQQPPQETTTTSANNTNNNTPTGDVRITNTPVPVSQAGTWDVNAFQSGTWDVNISGQPINVKYSDVNYATINATGSGDTQIVPAITDKRIRVIAFCIVASGAVNVKFRSGTTDITGPMSLVSGGGVAHAYDGGLFETAVNQPLNINLSAAQQVGGYIVYRKVD